MPVRPQFRQMQAQQQVQFTTFYGGKGNQSLGFALVTCDYQFSIGAAGGKTMQNYHSTLLHRQREKTKGKSLQS